MYFKHQLQQYPHFITHTKYIHPQFVPFYVFLCQILLEINLNKYYQCIKIAVQVMLKSLLYHFMSNFFMKHKINYFKEQNKNQ